jgi:hypothetical protein
MKDNHNLVSIYSGSESSVLLLKGRLDRKGIASEIRKDSKAGTWGIVPDNIELFIDPAQEREAEPIINEFIRNRRVDRL